MKLTVASALLVILWSCRNSPEGVVKRSGEPDLVRVEAADPGMKAAIAEARASLSTFEALLQAPQPGQTGFAVKAGFPHAGGTEHIWLIDPVRQGDSFQGTVNNEPVDTKAIALGQRVTVSRAAVSDWMYADNGVLKGGYTIRLLLARLSPGERDEAIKSMGLGWSEAA